MTVLNFPATPALDDTYTENGVTYTWNGNYWQANSGSALDDFYVKIVGDSMTGNLVLPGGGGNTAALQKQEIDALIAAGDVAGDHWDRSAGALKPKVSTDNVDIGGGKITLNANGSANYTGTINCGGIYDGYRQIPNANGALIRLKSDNPDNSDAGTDKFIVFSNGDFQNTKARIRGDGGADFNNDVLIGGTLPSSPNIALNADGGFSFGDSTGNNFVKQLTPGSRVTYSSDVAAPLIAMENTGTFADNALTQAIVFGANRTQARISCYSVGASSDTLLGGRLSFDTSAGSGGALSERMSIGDTGNIGIGGTLPSSPNIALNADGSSQFAVGTTGGMSITSDGSVPTNSSPVNGARINADLIGGFNSTNGQFFQVSSPGSNVTIGKFIASGTASEEVNISLNADGSAEFAGTVSTTAWFKSERSVGSYYVFQANGPAGESIRMNADGSAIFKGTVQTAGGVVTPSMVIELEADDDTKYTATTDAEGNETRVYNGEVLDVKESIETATTARLAMRETFQELLVAVQSATDFGQLKAAMLVALEDYA